MPLNLEQKKALVAEVADIAGKATSAVAAEYRGLTVDEMTELRAKARESGVYLRVVKNTLARRAVEDTDFACIQEGLVGPLLLAFSIEDPGSAARVIKDFAKEHPTLEVKLVSIGGKMLPASDLEALSKIPTYEEALSKLMATMKAPIQKFVTTTNEVPGKLVRTLAAIKDAKEAA